MANRNYFKRMLAKELGVKTNELTIEMINEYINQKEKEATHSIFETTPPVGVCTPIAQRIYLGLASFMPYQEELKLRNYIHEWNK